MKSSGGMQTFRTAIFLMFSLVTAALAEHTHEFSAVPPEAPVPTGPLGTPSDGYTFGARAEAAIPSVAVSPTQMDLKALVICGDGKEASLEGIEATLKLIGMSYHKYVAKDSPGGMTLAKLQTGSRALYNAIILTTPDAGYLNGTQWVVGLSPAEKAVLASYEAVCKVHQVTWYSYPNAELGFTGTPTAVDTSTTPLTVNYTANGGVVFFYANPANPVTISNAYTYLAPAATDGKSYPLLKDAAGNALALIRYYPDGRRNLAMTFDSNQNLLHHQLFAYGVINWVCNGVFLGKKRSYQSAQVDDIGLASDTVTAGEGLGGIVPGADYRMTGADLDAFSAWQAGVRNNANTSDYTVSMAFNGAGFIRAPLTAGQTTDTLKARLAANQGNYYWISHTLTHADEQPVSLENTAATIPIPNEAGPTINLPNGTFCAYQVFYNTLMGLGYTIPLLGAVKPGTTQTLTGSISPLTGYRGKDGTTIGNSNANIVTPAISGLRNPYFLSTYYVYGGRNMVGDTSTPTKTRPDGAPNAGFMINLTSLDLPRSNIVDPTIAQILVQPRYPTNLFYNVGTPAEWVAEYNAFYRSFYGRDLTYTEILDKESTVLVNYMIKGSNFPLMFHQANMRAYDGSRSLLGDLLSATFVKYNRLFAVPVKCLTMDRIGEEMRDRMRCDNSGMAASISYNTAGQPTALTITCKKGASVPLTGLYGAAYAPENYGTPRYNQWTSYVKVADNSTVTITLR